MRNGILLHVITYTGAVDSQDKKVEFKGLILIDVFGLAECMWNLVALQIRVSGPT